MSDLIEEMFPPFGLRITCGPLAMRCMRDTDVPPMAHAVTEHGIYDDGRVMPFHSRWPEELGEHGLPTAQFYWRVFGSWSVDEWRLSLRVEHDGELVGVQDLVAHAPVGVTRSLATGSWLLRNQQRRGIGTLMRQAVCAFAVDELGVEEMTSSAFAGNEGSLGVSRRTCYTRNGVRRAVTADGGWRDEVHVRLLAADLVRPPYPVVVTGADAFRRFIGLP